MPFARFVFKCSTSFNHHDMCFWQYYFQCIYDVSFKALVFTMFFNIKFARSL